MSSFHGFLFRKCFYMLFIFVVVVVCFEDQKSVFFLFLCENKWNFISMTMRKRKGRNKKFSNFNKKIYRFLSWFRQFLLTFNFLFSFVIILQSVLINIFFSNNLLSFFTNLMFNFHADTLWTDKWGKFSHKLYVLWIWRL